VDDPLLNIVHIAIWDACLHCEALLCIQLYYVVVSGQFFFSAWCVVSLLHITQQVEKKKKTKLRGDLGAIIFTLARRMSQN
jgi:hypothetical protein